MFEFFVCFFVFFFSTYIYQGRTNIIVRLKNKYKSSLYRMFTDNMEIIFVPSTQQHDEIIVSIFNESLLLLRSMFFFFLIDLFLNFIFCFRCVKIKYEVASVRFLKINCYLYSPNRTFLIFSHYVPNIYDECIKHFF